MAWLSSLRITAKLGVLAGALALALLVLGGTSLLAVRGLHDSLQSLEAEADAATYAARLNAQFSEISAAASSPSPSIAAPTWPRSGA